VSPEVVLAEDLREIPGLVDRLALASM